MPMSSREKKRLMRMGQKEPLSREAVKDAKVFILQAIDTAIISRWAVADDDERDALKQQRERVAKFLGLET